MKSLSLDKKVISLDIGAFSIKFAIGRMTKNEVIIEDYFSILTPEGSIEDGIIIDKPLIKYVIDEELNKRKIKTKNAYITINSSKIITRDVTIPRVEYEEIGAIIEFQVEDYIPIDKDDYIIQFKVIEDLYEDDLAKLKVLIIAVPKYIVDDYYDLLKKLNFNPLVMDFQPNSIAKFINHNELLNEQYSIQDITFAIIDIGHDNTKISLVRNGVILVTRIVEIGGNYIKKSLLNLGFTMEDLEELKEKDVDISHTYDELEKQGINNTIRMLIELLSEKIEIVYRYYISRKPGNKINMILLTGGFSHVNGLSNIFSNIFSIPSVNIDCLNNIRFNGSYSDYANAIGSLIRNQEV